ncbi:MAG: response regulator transcription factor [Lachnospiraceae bacterium]|nr:response regulator transcription factor [Lachnospiraceae bacterium]
MGLNIAVCEDSIVDTKHISSLLFDYQNLHGTDIPIEYFTSAEDLLKNYQRGKYQILFLDVEMSGMDGITLGKKIRSIPDDEVYIVYTSLYPQYMINGYDVRAFHFIQKPINDDRLFEILDNIVKDIEKQRAYLKLHTARGENRFVVIRDIYYIDVSEIRDHVDVHMQDKVFDAIHHLNQMYAELKNHEFIMIKRTTMVNTHHITGFSGETVKLDNGDELSVGRQYKSELQNLFSATIFNL